MKHLFLINPKAGSFDRTNQYRRQIEQCCQGLDYRMEISQAPGQIAEMTRKAGLSGEETRVYACGGDGTLNEVVNGAVGFQNLSITVFCGGSGNDFVKIFSDPTAFYDLPRLLDCEEAAFDLIRCNEDYSLNICSVGLDARIGTDVAAYKRIPGLSGFRAYAVSVLVNLFRGISEHYRLEINGKSLDQRFTMICACSGRFYGGGFNPVPEADPTDGVLNVLAVDAVKLHQVPGLIGKYKDGRYRELSEYIHPFEAKELTIHCDRLTKLNLDGELRMAQEIHLSVAKEKIRFFYPKGLTL